MTEENNKPSLLDKWRIPKIVPKAGQNPFDGSPTTNSPQENQNQQISAQIISNQSDIHSKKNQNSQVQAKAQLKVQTDSEEVLDFTSMGRAPRSSTIIPPDLSTFRTQSPLDEDGNKKAIYALDTIARLFEIVEKNSIKATTADQKAMVVMDLLSEATNRLPDYLSLFDSNASDWIRGKAMNQLVYAAANNWKNSGQTNLDSFINIAEKFFDRAHGDGLNTARKIVSDLVSGNSQRNQVPEVISALNDLRIEELKAEQKIYDRLEYAFDFFADNKYDVVQLIMSVNRDLVQEDIIPESNIKNGPLNQILFLKGRQVAICARMVLASFEQIAKAAKQDLSVLSGDAQNAKKIELKNSLYDGSLETKLRDKSYELLKNSLSGSNIFLDAMRNDFERKNEQHQHP